MNTARFPVLHQVTVEFVSNRQPTVYDCDSPEEAQRCIETAKENPEAWHIFHSIQKTPRGKHAVQVSLYRSHDTKEWHCRHIASENGGGG